MIELNLKTGATAQSTQSFRAMCNHGSVALGVNSTGLYKICCGYSDNGVEIPARMRSGNFDFGMENKKRFRYFYFGLDITGSLKLSIYGDGELAGEYMATGVAGQGLQNIRVPISRMVKARYWYWQIENIDGSFFVLYSIKALPVVTHPGRNSY